MGKHARYLATVALTLAVCVGLMQSLAIREAAWRAAPSFVAAVAENPATLSETDTSLYNAAFAAEARGDIKASDGMLAQISNRRLVGYVLAERYLGNRYTPNAKELSDWLAANADHPQAADINRLAANRGAQTITLRSETPLRGEGYADHMGRTTMPDSWYRGLALWREKNYSEALPLFAQIGQDEDLNDWQRSAGAYWAYRAAVQVEDRKEEKKQLAIASNYPTTFYGLLAARHYSTPQIEVEAPSVTRSLRQNPQAIRASLLSQLDRKNEAEEELRLLYTRLDDDTRPGLITLAHEYDLPNLQVRLSRMSQLSAAQANFARYPMPRFITEAQSEVNPALLLAIARNESAFRDVARSGAGALGMMQILPSTAHAIERHVGLDALEVASSGNDLQPIAVRLNDPATSARYSAQYLKILSREAAVGNNLIRTIAAYNAGPGNVASWQGMARNIDDPLLYIESIPYPETRNYVMQVLAQYWIYQILGGEQPDTLTTVNAGTWPELAASA